MSNFVTRSAVALGLAISMQPAFGITFDQGHNTTAHRSQGQLYYSDTVSRITNGTAQACMVSTGSDWAGSGQARNASDMAQFLDEGQTVNEAFEAAPPVDLKGLSSNTPFLAFIIKQDQTFMRFATGFNMNAETVDLSYLSQTGDAPTVRVETRGDTGAVRDSADAQAMLTAFMAGDVFTVRARSKKAGGTAQEHYIQYSFQGQGDHEALASCMDDLSDRTQDLVASSNVRLALTPADDADIRTRMTARAMACNRALDPNETDVLRLSGGLTGFSSPLAYALAKRDENGQITEIWSGDLWRISRERDGYVIAFSNSITRQSPLDAQDHKACTRFGAAQPIDLDFGATGSVTASPQFDAQLANAGWTPQAFRSARAATATRTATSGLSLSSGSAGGTSVARVVGGSSTGLAPDETPLQTMEDPNLVPVPAAGILLASILLGFGGWIGLSRRLKTA